MIKNQNLTLSFTGIGIDDVLVIMKNSQVSIYISQNIMAIFRFWRQVLYCSFVSFFFPQLNAVASGVS